MSKMSGKKMLKWGRMSATVGVITLIGSNFFFPYAMAILFAPFTLLSDSMGIKLKWEVGVTIVVILFFVIGAGCSLIKDKTRGIVSWIAIIFVWVMVGIPAFMVWYISEF